MEHMVTVLEEVTRTPCGAVPHWPPSGPLSSRRAARYLPFYPHSRGLEVYSESFIPR